MKINSFEDILSWQKWQNIARKTYEVFNNIKDFGFKDQIQRASVSISSNIAEWFERQSNKELRQFLFIAKWSCWEYRSLLYLAKDLGYINDNSHKELCDLSVEVSKLLSAFITHLSKSKTK